MRPLVLGSPGILAVLAVLILAPREAAAQANRCGAVWVNTARSTVHFEAGGCYLNEEPTAATLSRQACRAGAARPAECLPGHMVPGGLQGVADLSKCGPNHSSDTFLALAVHTKDGRPYTSVGCGTSRLVARTAALSSCASSHYVGGCRIHEIFEIRRASR